MTAFDSSALFNDLTEAETTELNGGRRCIRVWACRIVTVGFYRFWRCAWVIRCS